MKKSDWEFTKDPIEFSVTREVEGDGNNQHTTYWLHFPTETKELTIRGEWERLAFENTMIELFKTKL